MATEATQTITTPAAEGAPAATPAPAPEKAKNVLDDMDSRRVLVTTDDAATYIAKCATDFADFNDYPIAAPGLSVNEQGEIEFDPEVYTGDMRVMVSVLSERGDGPGTSKVKAIVIAPIPTLDAVLASNEARQWLIEKVLDKELNHIAVRQLRKAEDIADVVESMPTTLDAYITSNREGGGLLQAYEDLWRPLKNSMGKLSRPFRLANLSKKEFRRGMESAAYAEEYYPTLEKSKQGSLFVFALNGFIAQAKKQGLDPSIFERWLGNRDEKKIDVESEDEEEFSLEALAGAFESETKESDAAPANDANPAPEGEAPVTDSTEPSGDETAEMTEAELEAATAPESTDGGTEQTAPAS